MSLALSCRNLTKTFESGSRRLTVLDDVSFDIEDGATCAVVGPSGSGKTTLLGLCAGLDRPSSGSVALCGEPLETLDEDDRARVRGKHVGFIFQQFRLIPTLTALENVTVPLELAGRPVGAALHEQVVGVLGLADRLGHLPSQLSGGQQQRVAIARALVTQPDIVFADEPTGNLDSDSSAEVLGHLRRSVRELGTTVVMVTHELDAAAYADDVVVIHDGAVTAHLTDPSQDDLVAALRGRSA